MTKKIFFEPQVSWVELNLEYYRNAWHYDLIQYELQIITSLLLLLFNFETEFFELFNTVFNILDNSLSWKFQLHSYGLRKPSF